MFSKSSRFGKQLSNIKAQVKKTVESLVDTSSSFFYFNALIIYSSWLVIWTILSSWETPPPAFEWHRTQPTCPYGQIYLTFRLHDRWIPLSLSRLLLVWTCLLLCFHVVGLGVRLLWTSKTQGNEQAITLPIDLIRTALNHWGLSQCLDLITGAFSLERAVSCLVFYSAVYAYLYKSIGSETGRVDRWVLFALALFMGGIQSLPLLWMDLGQYPVWNSVFTGVLTLFHLSQQLWIPGDSRTIYLFTWLVDLMVMAFWGFVV
jgi:hypothetical protein